MVSNQKASQWRIEKRKMEFEVLSPVHIGSKEGRLTAFEFIIEPKKVHVVDEKKFGKFLIEKKLIDLFIQEVNKGPLRLDKFLKEKARFEIPRDLPKVVIRTIPGGESEMQEFRPFVRDGNGSIFIPGSSLKGVFRTALQYKMVKMDDNLRKGLDSQINNINDRDLAKKKKFLSENIPQTRQLLKFNLPGTEQGPHQDLFRCLTIRDAYPSGPCKTEVIRIYFLSKSRDGVFYWSQDKRVPGRDLSIWVEAVTEGKFETEILWDQKLLERFKIHNKQVSFQVNSIDELLEAIDEMNRDLIEAEKGFFNVDNARKPSVTSYKDYLKGTELKKGASGLSAAISIRKWYEDKTGKLFRAGFGSGMLSTTIDLLLSPSLRQRIRNVCGSDPRPGDPAPKSRRVWKKSDTECLPMGWFKLNKMPR